MPVPFQRILITGGAGFVGSNLARMLRESFPAVAVTALDNLKRRGSELSLGQLREAGVRFVHADIRCADDLEALPEFDLLIACAAEPSVSAGMDGAPSYVLQTNLAGTLACLELARLRGAAFLFLSTSRIYPVAGLNALAYTEDSTRYRWAAEQNVTSVSERGIAEDFPMDGPRSFYGASKLAAELVLGEYVHAYGVKALIDRCSVIAGPGQLSRVDQGMVTLWVACHHYRKPLTYMGFGGEGKQVRDVLHVRDLFDLIVLQLASAANWDGSVYNVGGGADASVSLKELTGLCRELTDHRIQIASDPRTSDVDVRIFVTDNTRVANAFGWRPTRGVERTLADVHGWIEANADALRPVLA